MPNLDIPRQRLYHQRIGTTSFATPEAVVQWLGAVQAQDYGGAKWAVAQRAIAINDAQMEQAFADGSILRTHVLRPTWHFVTPADIRWMLKLTAPRVNAFNAYYYRKSELDEAVFAQTNAAITKALEGGKHLTRAELATILQQSDTNTADSLRINLIMMRAELDAVICNGVMRGKQHTYALLDEWVPPAKDLSHEEAMAELARRYLTSHGPATLKDYIWWSGLSASEAKASFELVKAEFIQSVVGEQTYWLADNSLPLIVSAPMVYLLPNYDEYVVGYTERRAIFDQTHLFKLDSRANPLFNYTIVLNGQIIGTWKRTIKPKKAVIIETTLFNALNQAETAALADAAERYGQFLGLPVTLI